MDEFFKEEFQFQIARKDRLQQAVAFPVGLALASGTVIKTAWDSFKPESSCDWLLLGPTVLAIVALFVFVAHGTRFFVGHEYAFLPLTTEYEEFLKGFEEGADNSKELAKALRGAYIQGAAHNAKKNEIRSSALYYMNLSVASSLLFGTLGVALIEISNRF
jgi:nucleoside recognition membrane protein YjiH